MEGTAWFCRLGGGGSCRIGYCTMAMPGDERQMPGGVEATGIEGPTTAMEGESSTAGDSSGEWVFGSVLAVVAVLSVG